MEHRRPNIRHDSTLTAERIEYDPTYLQDDDGGASLFITVTADYQTAAGNDRTASTTDVLQFDTTNAMAEWIETVGATEKSAARA